MPQHEFRYEILAGGDKVVGEVWWDADKSEIDYDNPRVMDYLKGKSYNGITWHDGPKFLRYLGRILDNGYVHAKRVEN